MGERMAWSCCCDGYSGGAGGPSVPEYSVRAREHCSLWKVVPGGNDMSMQGRAVPGFQQGRRARVAAFDGMGTPEWRSGDEQLNAAGERGDGEGVDEPAGAD